MNKENSEKEFEKEIEALKEQLDPSEVFILGFLKGFTRNDLKIMAQREPSLFNSNMKI